METNIKNEILQLSLGRLLTGYFNMSTLDYISSAAGVDFSKDTHSRLLLLHCVHYTDMSNDVKNWLIETLEETFGGGSPSMIAMMNHKLDL